MTKANSNTNSEAQGVEAQEQATHGVDSIVEAIKARPQGAGVTGKDVRRWLRTNVRAVATPEQAREALPGKGGRYAFTAAQVEAFARAYVTRKAQQGTNAPASILMAALAPAPGE